MDAKELGQQPAYPKHPGSYVAGLTKREDIAKVAMQGLLANSSPPQGFFDESGNPAKSMAENAAICARYSVCYADALLAELAKGE